MNEQTKKPLREQWFTKKLQKDYIMERQKEQIKIVNVMADGRIVEDMSTVVIPNWHPYYAVQEYFTREDIA